MGYKFFNLLVEDGVGIVELNRPPANSLNAEFTDELGKAFQELKDDDNVKVILVRSAIPGFFVAGADIKMFAEMTPLEGKAISRRLQEVFQMLEDMDKISIAAIGGFALGGGLEFALACDFRFASKTAKVKDKERQVTVGLPETSLGVIPGAGGTQRLARLIGPKKALFYISQAAQMTTEEAYNLGIIEKLFETDEEMNEAALKFAKSLAKKATYAIGCAKRAIYDGVNETLEVGLKFEAQEFYNCFESDDSSEGFNAFIEKRKPDFKGK
jgi:enoyl-CoA hydratase